jgi:hypothetical protein
MKSVGAFVMTYLTVTQLETRHRQIDAELERKTVKAAGRRVERRRSRRWFRAVRGAAAA